METDHRFGVCPSGGIYVSLMCPLSPPVSLRPQTPSVCPLWWGLGPGFCPACVPGPGKEREGECGGVSRGLVPRGSSPAGLQAASLGWSSAQRSCSPVCGGSSCSKGLCSLHIPVVCQPKGNSDYVRHLEGWGAATPYFSSLRSGKHHIVAKGPSLSTQVLAARSPAGQGATYLPSGLQPPCLEGVVRAPAFKDRVSQHLGQSLSQSSHSVICSCCWCVRRRASSLAASLCSGNRGRES